ncbi:MAG: transcriptional repressor [Myxococcales bacterium]|nr:transcriptional repressor [Myxococcales bacterium]
MRKKTEQRGALRTVLRDAGRPLTAQEVLDAAQADVPGIGMATVYRNLNALVEEGWLRLVELPGEPARFERSGQKHHHHFQCDDCGKVYDVPGCTSGIEKLGLPGFTVERHEVLLYGTCAECDS